MNKQIEKVLKDTISKIINNEDFNMDDVIKDLNKDEKEKFILAVNRQVAFIKMQETNKMTGKCYNCKYKESISNDINVSCNCLTAQVFGTEFGIKNEYFMWPISFNPLYLQYCDSFKSKE